MNTQESKKAWEQYRDAELAAITPILSNLGYILDAKQVHIGGERYLMAGARDVGGGGKKIVLIGARESDQKRVIIKVSSDPAGIAEIERERNTRTTLHRLEFALRTFYSPEELHFATHGPCRIYITAYIEEARSFLEHSLDEQFFLSLRALETQEGVHATTEGHVAAIRKTFGMTDADTYVASYRKFAEDARAANPDDAVMAAELARGEAFLQTHRIVIAHYCGFLTHADFVPNNMRISGNEIFLLDYASIHFGNKYESWARFINFMIHHNTHLEELLVRYVRENRGKEEFLSLRLMRVFKLAFLLRYHTQALYQSTGDLHTLIQQRIIFWTAALTAVLDDKPVPKEVIDTYVEHMKTLRSEEEKARQRQMLGQYVRV